LEAGQVKVSISGKCQDILTVGSVFGERALVQTEHVILYSFSSFLSCFLSSSLSFFSFFSLSFLLLVQVHRSATITALTDVHLLVFESSTYYKVVEHEMSLETDLGKVLLSVSLSPLSPSLSLLIST
jgi:CRP-like cAMP-binding protein